MWPSADRNAGRPAAVIDIGSNSVRLVVYRLEGRAIWTLFNEKALAGLGRDLPATRKLSAAGAEVALTALRRFRAVLDGWDPGDIQVVATAAVREAQDGPEFARRVQAETGLAVRVLSGGEEARYAALGVLAGQPDAQGVVGDLGGSSLELSPVGPEGPSPGLTLPLGPFALGAPQPLDAVAVRRAADAQLGPVADRFAAPCLHAVGGAWRNLALLHMNLADYPLRIAHQYEMSRSDALELARFIAHQSSRSLEGVKGVSKKRFETLPFAALVLEAVIEHLRVEQVVISAFGLREGLLLDSMPPDVRRQDPLIAGCAALTAARGLVQNLGPALEKWLTPSFQNLAPVFGERDGALTSAACRLADLGGRLHPDHRAEIAFEQVLRAPFSGVSHAERAFLACAVYARHTANGAPPEGDTISRVLTAERRRRALALGAAIRLGSDLSGRNPALLSRSSLAIEGDRLILSAAEGYADMLLGEQTARRAATLAAGLGLRLQID